MEDAPTQPRITKHRQIVEFLRERLISGHYQPGDQLPTEEELVKKFATSRPTVSKAMRELTSEGRIERRAGSGTFAIGNSRTTGNMLGLLIPGLGRTEIFEPICAQLASVSQRNGFSLVWGNSTPINGSSPVEQAEELCQQYIDQYVAGVFFAPIELDAEMHRANQQIAARLTEAGITVILLDRDLEPFPARSAYDLVTIDNRRAGYALTQHLLDVGCHEIHFLARAYSAPTVDARIAGYREALLANKLAPKLSLIHRSAPEDPALLKKINSKNTRTGVVCANDAIAARFMQTLDAAGVRVPEQVCVTGIDDVKYAQLLQVPLTTWRQPCADIGTAAFNAMNARLDEPSLAPHEILLSGELVVRSSTTPQP